MNTILSTLTSSVSVLNDSFSIYRVLVDDFSGRLRQARVLDHQIIDSATEHLLYCVSDRKTPWHLPYRSSFTLLSKVVITHVAKGKCKLGIYSKIDWSRRKVPFGGAMISRAALSDMELDALDLVDVLADQVRRLVGVHGRTKKAVTIFGLVGQHNQISEFAGSDSPLKARLRRSRKPRSLMGILVRDVGSLLETVAASILQMITACVRWSWKTFSANFLILLVLLSSFALNLVFSSKGLSTWWQERKIENLMTRLGIGAHQSMTHAVFVNELVEATASNTAHSDASSSVCRDTFDDLMNLSHPSIGIVSTASSPERQAATALRLQRTRKHLGTRRHDLLVAIRVVNSIEREMVDAEWESWLREENARCRQLGTLIKLNNTDGQSQAVDKLAGRRDEIVRWHESYCGSCREEERVVAL